MTTEILKKNSVNFSHYAGALSICLRTSANKILKQVPERPIELGGERRAFDLNVLVFESLRTILNKREYEQESYTAMETFSKYITRIDDIMDGPKHPKISEWNTQYRTDQKAMKIVSLFVRHIKSMANQNIITQEQASEIFKATIQYRKQARQAIKNFEENTNPNFQEILSIKNITTGGMGAILADIFCMCEGVAENQRKTIREAFSNAFMATQIADDIKDLKNDNDNGVPNIATALIRQRYNDEIGVLNIEDMDIKTFRKLAPKSYSDLMLIGNDYISMIPNTPYGLGVLKAMPSIFYKVIKLTSRGN